MSKAQPKLEEPVDDFIMSLCCLVKHCSYGELQLRDCSLQGAALFKKIAARTVTYTKISYRKSLAITTN